MIEELSQVVRAVDGPLLADVGIMAVVPDKWIGPMMGRHQILRRLARYFNVVWVEPCQGWREWWIHRNAVAPPARPDIARGFSVYRPGRWLPQFYRPRSLAKVIDTVRLHRARTMLRRQGAEKIVLSLWRPEYGDALDRARYDLCSYHIADEYSFSDREHPIDSTERAVIERADQIFIHSSTLMKKKGRINPHTALIPNGVDYAAFSAPCEEPMDLKSIPRPRIGYVGVVKRQLDFHLVSDLVRAHPHWSFVFVGPEGVLAEDEHLVRQLSAMRNVFFLGSKTVAELPAYVHNMDVCILCYDVNDYTRYIYPLKLHEYLAAGRPVVSAPIPAVADFSGVISIARTVDEWSAALAAQLAPSALSPSVIERRQAIAQQHDWNRLARTTAEVLCRRLGPGYIDRFNRLCVDLDAVAR